MRLGSVPIPDFAQRSKFVEHPTGRPDPGVHHASGAAEPLAFAGGRLGCSSKRFDVRDGIQSTATLRHGAARDLFSAHVPHSQLPNRSANGGSES